MNRKNIEWPFLVRLIFLFPVMVLMGVIYSLAAICSLRFLGFLLKGSAEILLREKDLGLTQKHYYEGNLPKLKFLLDFKVKDTQFLKGQYYPPHEFTYNMMMELLSTGALIVDNEPS